MLDYLQEWNQLESASILAIFGPTEERDTWVTEFSLDMIQAFQVQDLLVAAAMCDRPAGQIFTPTTVIKKLICQVLEQRPELTVEVPDILNLRVFQKITNFNETCCLFRSVVARMTTPFAIIVDRIDCCQADMSDGDPQDLVGFLSKLLTEHARQLKIIITSAEEPPEDEDLDPELAVSICMISTRKRPLHKEEYYRRARRKPTFRILAISANQKIKWYDAVGAEQLYKFRWLFGRGFFDLFCDGELKPRTPRERMIYRRSRYMIVSLVMPRKHEGQGGFLFSRSSHGYSALINK